MKEVEVISKVVGKGTGKSVPIGGGGTYQDLSAYLLKSVWDSVFEIKTDGSGQKYIFGKLPVVTRYGITMYAEGDDVDIPSLAEGLPFDQRTIWYNPTTNQIEVIGGTGGGEGGVPNFWDLSGIPSWITSTKPTYSYSEILGTPDLSGYATTSALNAVSTKLNDFLEGSDTDTVINKWKELETFLSGLTESDNLATILAGKADKSYVDSTFVTIAGTEDVTGLHNFVNGLKIGGVELVKKQGDVVYLDGNLVVRGGVTMYAENEVDIPSILDSLPIASNTALGIASFDSTYFSVDSDGMVSLTSAPSSGASYLGELLNVDASIDATASVDRILYQPQGSNMWTWRELPKDGVVGNYLPLSGGTLNGSLLVQANPSEWLFTTKTNTSVVYAAHADNYGIFASTKSARSDHYLLRLHYNDNTLEGSGYTAMVVKCNGVVAIGNMSSNYALNVEGDMYVTNWLRTNNGWYNELYGGGMYMMDNNYIRTYGGKIVYIEETGLTATNTYGIGGHVLQLMIGGSGAPHSSIMLRSNTVAWGICSNTNGNMYIGRRPHLSTWDYSSDVYVLEVSTSGLLCFGGITMYSDQRKKTILNHVELSLKQIADAPLIEHYYNSDQNKTTHVGSIAQYWAGLNDWFCKLDNEGFYTMEIQNCALASAISIARHLEKYESKTDKKIRMLKKRVQELEDKLEKLEGGNYGNHS